MTLNANSDGVTVWGNVGLSAAVMAPGGVDVSKALAASFLAGSVLRTLASRFTDNLSIFDFGIVGDGTDETVKYVTALTESALAGCSLHHPAGITVSVSGIVAPAGFHLIMDGTVFLLANSNTHILRILTGNATVIEGTGVFDGNRANNTNTGGTSRQQGTGGIVTTRIPFTTGPMPTKNLLIRDITIQNIVNWPVSIASTDTALISNVKVYSVGNTFQSGDGSISIHINECLVDGSDDIAFGFYRGASYSTIANCIARNAAAAYGVLNDTGSQPTDDWQNQVSHDITLYCNKAFNTNAYAIILNAQAAAKPYRIDVLDNQLEDSGVVGSDEASGILLSNTIDCRVMRNRINGGGTVGHLWQGLQINGSNTRCSVDSNWISNGGTVGGVPVAVSSAVGIVLGATNSRFESNEVWDDNTASPTMTVGFSGTVGTGCAWLLNRARNMKTSIFDAATPFLGDTSAIAYMSSSSSLTFFGGFIVSTVANLTAGATVSNGGVNVVGGVNGNGNNLGLNGGAVGGKVGLVAFGTDTNIDVTYATKGTGSHLFSGGNAVVPSLNITVSGPKLIFGTGAPTITANKTSLFFRGDGAAGTRIYVNQDGNTTWLPIAGV